MADETADADEARRRCVLGSVQSTTGKIMSVPDRVVKLRQRVDAGRVTCQACKQRIAVSVFSLGIEVSGDVVLMKALCRECYQLAYDYFTAEMGYEPPVNNN